MSLGQPVRAAQSRKVSATALALGQDDPSNDSTHFTYAFRFHKETLRTLMTERGLHSVCEVGGGRTPLFSPREIAELGLRYTLLDISAAELALAPPDYDKVAADICGPLPDGTLLGEFDLVFSTMLAEHVRSAKAMHLNILKILKRGGVAFHFFPTLFSPAFVLNRALPERSATALLHLLHRGAPEHAKFPARYSWCYGPSAPMRRKISALGYLVLSYRGFYGTAYLRPFPVLGAIEDAFHRAAERRRSRWFTSYAWLVVEKP